MKPGDRVQTNTGARAAGIRDRSGVLVEVKPNPPFCDCAVVLWDGFADVCHIGAHFVEPEGAGHADPA